MKKLFIAAITITSSFYTFAQQTIIFECKTTNNKIVSIKQNENTVSYQFGRNLSYPELSFSIPKNSSSTFQWAGVEREIYYDVDVPNGNTVYTAYSSIDRMSDDHQTESGITVSINNRQIAKILCDQNKKPYVNNMEGVRLPTKN